MLCDMKDHGQALRDMAGKTKALRSRNAIQSRHGERLLQQRLKRVSRERQSISQSLRNRRALQHFEQCYRGAPCGGHCHVIVICHPHYFLHTFHQVLQGSGVRRG